MSSAYLCVKSKFYEKMAVPTVTYEPDTWGLRMDEQYKLDVLEIKDLRMMCGLTWMTR